MIRDRTNLTHAQITLGAKPHRVHGETINAANLTYGHDIIHINTLVAMVNTAVVVFREALIAVPDTFGNTIMRDPAWIVIDVVFLVDVHHEIIGEGSWAVKH